MMLCFRAELCVSYYPLHSQYWNSGSAHLSDEEMSSEKTKQNKTKKTTVCLSWFLKEAYSCLGVVHTQRYRMKVYFNRCFVMTYKLYCWVISFLLTISPKRPAPSWIFLRAKLNMKMVNAWSYQMGHWPGVAFKHCNIDRLALSCSSFKDWIQVRISLASLCLGA